MNDFGIMTVNAVMVLFFLETPLLRTPTRRNHKVWIWAAGKLVIKSLPADPSSGKMPVKAVFIIHSVTWRTLISFKMLGVHSPLQNEHPATVSTSVCSKLGSVFSVSRRESRIETNAKVGNGRSMSRGAE